jgi:hypothetical protein
MDEATFMTTYVEEYCDIVQSCCGASQLTFDRAACETNASQRFDVTKTGVAVFDPERGAQCIAHVRAYATECATFGVTVLFGPGFGCADVYHGEKAPGEACVPGDCAVPANGSAFCGLQNVCEVIVSDIAPGASCLGTGTAVETHLCVDGYECSLETNHCERETCRAPLGAPCGDGLYCAGQAYCSASTQKCTPLSLVGGPCSDDDQCTSLDCVDGTCSIGIEADACLGLT